MVQKREGPNLPEEVRQDSLKSLRNSVIGTEDVQRGARGRRPSCRLEPWGCEEGLSQCSLHVALILCTKGCHFKIWIPQL